MAQTGRKKAKPSPTGERFDSNERAASILDNHIVQNTKSIYKGKLKVIIQWMIAEDVEDEVEPNDSTRVEHRLIGSFRLGGPRRKRPGPRLGLRLGLRLALRARH